MRKILDIAQKDLLQLVRDRNIFLFLLIMPLLMTLLLGFAFGGFSREQDNRLPVGYLDLDGSRLSKQLGDLLSHSEVIRLEAGAMQSEASLSELVANEKLAGAVVVPAGYGETLLHGRRIRLKLIADTSRTAGRSIESEALSAVQRVDSATRAALVLERVSDGKLPFDYAFQKALKGWDDPPIQVVETTSSAIPSEADGSPQLAHTSPGMMLQFAIAGLMTSGQIMVSERRSRSLQRLFTTATPGWQILGGHFLAVFTLICGQFLVLIAFGTFILKVDYLRAPGATLLVAFSSAFCIASLGILIGVLAKTEEQAVIFSLIPMFVLSGMGGTMVPLEVTGETFRMVGHLSPLAWSMDGFKNVIVRGLGLELVVLPAALLAGYALVFLALAGWRFSRFADFGMKFDKKD